MSSRIANIGNKLRSFGLSALRVAAILSMLAQLGAQAAEQIPAKGGPEQKTNRKAVVRLQLATDSASVAVDGQNPVEPAESSVKPAVPGELFMRLRFPNGGLRRVKVAAKTVAIVTAYGRLVIPIEDIRSIELAPRLPDVLNKKVQNAIARLGSSKPEERSAAGPELFNLREKSFIALLRASKSKDKELAKRAKDLVEDLRSLVPPATLEAPIQDVIETDDSKFAGDIDLSSLELTGFRFAEIEVNRVDRQVAKWVLWNNGLIWTTQGPIPRLSALPSHDFSVERVYLHDQTAPFSLHGPFLRPGNKIEFNRADIDRLGALTALKNLEFTSSAVTDEVVERLRKLTSLERLILSGTSITDACLHSLTPMKRLNRLDVSNTAITDRGLIEMAKLKSLTDLSLGSEEQRTGQEQPHPPDLFLNNTRTTEAAIAQLQEALPNCMICASHLYKEQGASGLVPLPPKAGAPDRTWSGWLLGYRIGNCELFTSASPETPVTSTDQLPAREFRIVKLCFQSSTAPRGWSTPLAELMLRRLADLPDLRRLRFGQLPVATFPGLRKFKKLTSLEIDATDATDESLQSLNGLTELTTLTLRSKSITDDGLRQLAPLRELRRLDLSANSRPEFRSGSPSVSGSGFDVLSGLDKLRFLDVTGAGIVDDALAHIGRLHDLETLKLSGAPITGKGLAQLAALRRLKVLELAGCHRLQGANLGGLANLPALETLNLSGSSIDDSAVEPLKKLATLRKLILSQTRVTEMGATELRAALPKCTLLGPR